MVSLLTILNVIGYTTLLKLNSEKKLRRWLTANSVNAVTWVEPNRGSTLGVADAFLSVGDRFVAVELKLADATGVVNFRPVQRHWHGLAAFNNISTFCLVAWNPGSREPSRVLLVDMMSAGYDPVVIATRKHYDSYRKGLTPGKKLQWALAHRRAWADIGLALIV